jgi:Carboxypeptidase regulatory-like domain
LESYSVAPQPASAFFEVGSVVSRVVRLALLVTLFIPAGAGAQNYLASVRGIVSGPTGDPLVGATLTLTREETGETRETVTGADGQFTIVPVAPSTAWSYRRRATRGTSGG